MRSPARPRDGAQRRSTVLRALPLLAATVLLAGCGGSGITAASLTGATGERCPVEEQLEAAFRAHDLPTDLEPSEGGRPVTVRDGDDGPDRSLLADTDGAQLICRFDGPDDLEARVELVSLDRSTGLDEEQYDDGIQPAWDPLVSTAVGASGASDDEGDRLRDRLRGAEPGESFSVPGAGDGIRNTIALVPAADDGSAAVFLQVEGVDLSEADARDVTTAFAERLGEMG